MNIAKLLRLSILKSICEGLLFDCFNGYMVLKFQGLDCMATSGFRVRVTGIVFVFKLASLVLNRVQTCAKTGTFESIKCLYWLFWVILNGFRLFLDHFGSF